MRPKKGKTKKCASQKVGRSNRRELQEELCDAAQRGDIPAMRSLVRQGADVNWPSDLFRPLFGRCRVLRAGAGGSLALRQGRRRPQRFWRWLQRRTKEQKNTALHVACGTNQLAVYAKLVACGARAGAVNSQGQQLPLGPTPHSQGGGCWTNL